MIIRINGDVVCDSDIVIMDVNTLSNGGVIVKKEIDLEGNEVSFELTRDEVRKLFITI